jgi:cytoskeletal protein CcmA (bactofilin family)
MNIGASVVIKGKITAGEDFTVTGRVEGEISLKAGTLVLEPGSRVVGEVAVPAVVVHGSLDGNLTATDRVDVRPGASVIGGSITTPVLIVADGATLNCRVEMPAAVRPQAAPSVAAPNRPVAAV